MDKKVRELVWQRSRGYCEVCGFPLDPESWDFSHRKARKHKGPDTPENGMAIHHHPCHLVDIELHPRLARDKGWRVISTENPLEIPIWLYGKLKVWLEPDGTYRFDD